VGQPDSHSDDLMTVLTRGALNLAGTEAVEVG